MEPLEFSYTQDKSAYLPIALLFGLLCLAESAVLAYLAANFLPAPWNIVAVVAFALFQLLPARVLTAPLFTQHQLDQNGLAVRYGITRWMIERDWVASVEPVHQNLSGFEPLAGSFDEENSRMLACFSEQGQVMIRLKQPQIFPLGFGRHAESDTLLINADRADRLCDLMGFFTGADPAEASDAGPLPATPAAATPSTSVSAPVTTTTSGETVLSLNGLTRRFGAMTAVDALDLTVAHGEIVGLLGCNGAGKTTTIKMMTGLLAPSQGSVTINGFNLWRDDLEAKHHFGYVPDHAAFYGMLSGREQLEFTAQVRGIPLDEANRTIDSLLTTLDLAGAQNRSNETYSLGMKRKLSLAAALLHQPALLILDEPFNGLDPWASQQLKDMLRAGRERGMAILLSTHDLATAEQFCDRVAVIHQGRKLADRPVADLVAEFGSLQNAFFSLTATSGGRHE